jgi:hypothetical protein
VRAGLLHLPKSHLQMGREKRLVRGSLHIGTSMIAVETRLKSVARRRCIRRTGWRIYKLPRYLLAPSVPYNPIHHSCQEWGNTFR